MSYETKKLTIYFCRQLSSALLLLILLPVITYSAELVHTIQIGSHLVEHRAERQYGAVFTMLQEQERGYLRIEKIGGYYVLRLGKFTAFQEAEDLLQKISSVYHDAEMMRAYVSNNKLIKIYRPAAIEEPAQGGAEKSAPTFLELQQGSAPILEEKQVAIQPVDVEASSSVIPELKQDPPVVTMIAAVAEQVSVTSERQEKPPVNFVETAERPLPVDVAEPAADLTVAVKSPGLPVSVANPVKSMVVAEPSAAVVDQSRQTIVFRLKIIFAFVFILLIILVLFVRTKKTVKLAPLGHAAFDEERRAAGSVEAAGQNIAVSRVEPAVSCAAAAGVATAETASEDFSSAELSGDKEESLISRLRESRRNAPVAKTASAAAPFAVQLAPNEAVPAVVKIATTDSLVTESPDKKAAKPSREERQNRVSKAMEAAMFGKEKK